MTTDTDRINFLQRITDEKRYTGKVLMRYSITGRGWRLHETSMEYASKSVRDAIDNAMKEWNKEK